MATAKASSEQGDELLKRETLYILRKGQAVIEYGESPNNTIRPQSQLLLRFRTFARRVALLGTRNSRHHTHSEHHERAYDNPGLRQMQKKGAID
jgi:hypothetical protein